MESQTATSVRPAVEDVHEGHRQDIGFLRAGKVGDMGIERHVLHQFLTSI